jgi:hypothetical protein
MDFSAKPNIIKSANPEQTVAEIKKNPSGWFKKNIIKIIVAVLIIAVVAELIFGGITLFSPSSTSNSAPVAPKINSLRDAVISLVPDKTSYKRGDTVTVDVKLFTGGYTTDSTDLVVKFDPAFLKPADEFAKKGSIYSEYPAVQVEPQQGLIGISGITLPGSKSFSGVGSFATLYFTAVQDGQTQVTVDFEKDATADSNVVLSGSTDDLLGIINNAQINISDSASGQAPQSSGESCSSFTQYCQTADGLAGTQVCMGGTVVNGACGYDSLVTVSCDECKTQ